MAGEVDAEADHHRVALPLEQDAGELGAVDEQIVGPFDLRVGSMRCDRLAQRNSRDQSERGRRRVAGLEAHQRRSVEVAGRRDPRFALPPLAAGLPLGAQPQAFGGAVACESSDIVVGGARFGDGADMLCHTTTYPNGMC